MADTPAAPVPAEAAPSDSALRRALRRVRDGSTLDVTEAAVLLAARGEHLDELLSHAGRVRDAGLVEEGRPGVVTYSRNVFIPLTRLCRDRCHYCTFATVPHRLDSMFLERDEVVEIARQGAAQGCKEALFTLGDRPEERWPQAREWLEARGYDSTLDYVRACAIAVLEETGLLPHLNPGVMSWEEITRLKPVAASMGMMLETTSQRLFEKGGPHFGSPDKEPAVRVRALADAGRVGVPFTTGILIGIGENRTERAESLFAIRSAARQHGHVQEVIVQNFRAKPDTAMANDPDADLDDLAATIAVSRLVLGPKVRLQAPPNLVGDEQALMLRAGIDDWGGVSPVTVDHVSPEMPWPAVDELARVTAEEGFELRERLTAYPKYVRAGSPWIDTRLHGHVAALATPDGLADPGAVVQGLPWQEPDGGFESTGRTDLHTAVDTEGRTDDRRSDFGSVYGDWDEVAAELESQRARARAPERLAGDVKAGLELAASDPAALLDPANEAAAMAVLTGEGPALRELTRLADDVRRQVNGDDVTYVVNRNINFSNVCYVGCRFCAFAQRERDADAFRLSLDEIAQRAAEAARDGATEVCVQGGIDPQLPVSFYADLVRAVHEAVPGMHVHAFSPMEIVSAAAKAGVSIREWLSELKAAGLGSIPGTAAEILDDEVRWVLTKGKLPASQWIEVVSTAHELGIPSSSTMMYGHVDEPRHWLGHLRTLASVQDRTGGFTEFVPLPFVHHNAPIYLAGIARPGPTERDNRAVHAFARLALHGRIDHVQVSWVKLGDELAGQVLNGGADDMGGTLMEETISRMAGSENGSERSVEELTEIAHAAGRPVRQRTTTYRGEPSVLTPARPSGPRMLPLAPA
ncbi:7,8-didemethyl-8-hydroxy-5-deazariboflavin synthase subunit [Pseudonocardia sp. Ae168_Ps1]|uniref:bifunctional FO biosynthesis protein CofGH n=1 Tax=unclassified Pseudonocardia TaxID=2619320 RepID=UPI00094AE526|nr:MULTISPECIES: bifunctional FO biosynthesis protein CofGH [unclassified Pseudonocardia]OLL74031.1 7,8-didemethyl-8-hydroxy-5-deazariboflavin synthase [Pseudonocardia sp. Ae150A_Ps1]OLL80008.1 7,8-didemethyl-8-hydroxy-5-deazariboflavin synthase subunit [Pseudonocardia sp. Ae168_Ps1]OLL85859.1 7,8-didemethyl-8-hydroxy-5-deazariboflavin synthase [Pseudonocardia sp. Ae263_Ps1]OLL94110.1 7,8-didemethyl-8-hydroxy-5-deazariboflavin synthase [Pseudonocardia sp. Ae356_Ps1]